MNEVAAKLLEEGDRFSLIRNGCGGEVSEVFLGHPISAWLLLNFHSWKKGNKHIVIEFIHKTLL